MLLKYQMELLDAGYGYEALELENILSRSISNPKEAVEVRDAVASTCVAQLVNLLEKF